MCAGCNRSQKNATCYSYCSICNTEYYRLSVLHRILVDAFPALRGVYRSDVMMRVTLKVLDAALASDPSNKKLNSCRDKVAKLLRTPTAKQGELW